MKSNWLNRVLPIAAIFSFRMLGLFMLVPVFTIYAVHLKNATPVLIGTALGGYGLSQGILQIPMGWLSDKFGRKPIIAAGLFFFMVGSLIGALTNSIYGMILARTLQGMGAVGSVLIALLADLTRDEDRTKAMAVIGATIGLSFSLAMVISPSLTAQFGLASIFYLTAILALAGLLLLFLIIPTPSEESSHLDSEAKPSFLRSVLSNRSLQRLNFGIFCQHFVLTATFFAVPFLLQEHLTLGHLTAAWKFYLPVMIFSFVAMLPLIMYAEKKHQVKRVFISAVITTAMCQLMLVFFARHWQFFAFILFIYFVAFNFLEANLPSLVSRQADVNKKGTAMGIYSSCQFLGIFAGGLLAGILYQFFEVQGIFLINALLTVIWVSVALFMAPPRISKKD